MVQSLSKTTIMSRLSPAITSPNYPGLVNSSVSLSCSWNVRAQYGSKVMITVIDLEVGDTCFSNKLEVKPSPAKS